MKPKSRKPRDNSTAGVRAHYDAIADEYRNQYDSRRLKNPVAPYPANQFRLKLLLDSFKRNKIKSVCEVGFGEGTPLIELSRLGMDVYGFDLAPKMVNRGKERFVAQGLDSSRVFLGDIQDKSSYAKSLSKLSKFDGIVAMGVMPHVVDDVRALKNMKDMVRPGGRVFIEFRNSLFSLFTQNRYTADFILNDLLKDVSPRMKTIIEKDLGKRMRMDQPIVRSRVSGTNMPGYDAILSKFHNPFEVTELFKKVGFRNIKLLWYHYHAAMPYLQADDPKLFFEESKKLEFEKSGWKGYFLCSAFVVEAEKP